MRIHNAQEVLDFWEEVYGDLDQLWKVKFLKHPCMKSILKYQSDNIKVAIRRNQKLTAVLDDLENQKLTKETFDRKVNPYYDSERDESQSKIESREKDGDRWGRTF